MTNSIGEMEDCEVMFIIGSNTNENHPVIGSTLRRAVTQKGGKLIVADPRRIGMVRDATIWLQHRPGTDAALINGMLNVILAQGLQNQEFIDSRTENFEAMKKVVAGYTPDKVSEITGVPAKDIIAAARLYAGAKTGAIFYAMGITQHTNGTDNVKNLANLAMVCGHVGRPATGVNPLRGQNNVQGACDMGGLPGDLPGYQKVADLQARKKVAAIWGRKTLPAKVGLTVTEMMDATEHGEVKVLYIMGENPMVSDPNLRHVEKSLKKTEFLVVQDIFLTETAALADVVLPSAAWAERDGTFTNTERRVQRIRKAVDAPGQAREDWWIITQLAKRLNQKWDYKSPKQVFDEIAKVTPSYAGISYARLERGNGLQWPCPTSRHPGTPILHAAGFARGKGFFTPVEHQEPAETPNKAYPFTLTTGRILYHYHTRSMTGRAEGLNQLAPECEVEINPADARSLRIKDGQMVKVASRRGAVTAKAWVTDRVAKGVVFMPFHFAEAAANRLTIGALDPVAKIPEFKVCTVKLQKA